MKHYVGIDLGTTNSAICSYDGDEVRIWKSPDQHDVTPSAIFIDRRGNKYVGQRAYNSAPQSPGNAALLFKRFMGTNTPITLSAVQQTKTPEECSAEILKTLFGYLSEGMRTDPDIGTVITVPAAFNQMQKDATVQAAELAQIGKVALMQEPVAAVMRVMRSRKTDGMFMIYDLGGGTLDVAIAESSGGRVNLLAHGGKSVCGGRDFDRLLLDNVVKPWLIENFDLPDDLSVNAHYKTLLRLAVWAAEKAKIELSAKEQSVIGLSEIEVRMRDQSGVEIYLDVPLDRSALDRLIAEQIDESIQAAHETMRQAGLSAHDFERIVFIGGPTNYKPLCDKVSFELGIPGSNEVNPMTAVAEGAALFAESIDWSSQQRSRKSNRGKLASGSQLELNFNYIARTPESRAKVAVQLGDRQAVPSAEFQIDSQDTGWTSGRLPLTHGATLDLPLGKLGDNLFKVFVFDASGHPISLAQDQISITRTAATVDAIPASYAIGIEVLTKLGGRPYVLWLLQAGDHLPKQGQMQLKAGESLKAGSTGSLNFRLYEGNGQGDEPSDYRQIGVFKILGRDFDQGVIPAGDDLYLDWEVLDSGHIQLEVSVPSVSGSFRSGNFYSRQEGQFDFNSAADEILDEAQTTLHRLEEISTQVEHPQLDRIRSQLGNVLSLDTAGQDNELVLKAREQVLEARSLLSEVRRDRLSEIRRIDLDNTVEFFDEYIRQYARPSEERAFDNAVANARRAIDKPDRDFEDYLDDLRSKNFTVLWRQDWFVVGKFKSMVAKPYQFSDQRLFEDLVAMGEQCMKRDEIEKLRQVVAQLAQLQMDMSSETDLLEITNIIRG